MAGKDIARGKLRRPLNKAGAAVIDENKKSLKKKAIVNA